MKVLILPLGLASILWSDTLCKHPLPQQTLTYLFTYLFCKHTWFPVLFNGYKSFLLLFVLMLKLSQTGLVGTPYSFQAHFCVFLTCPHHALNNSFEHFFGTKRYSRLIFYFPCPGPRIRHFLREPWLLLVENVI